MIFNVIYMKRFVRRERGAQYGCLSIMDLMGKAMSVKNAFSMKDLDIKKTYLYNFNPLKPHFCKVKLGFTGVYIIFLISSQKHKLWYSLEPPWRGGSTEYPQSMF